MLDNLVKYNFYSIFSIMSAYNDIRERFINSTLHTDLSEKQRLEFEKIITDSEKEYYRKFLYYTYLAIIGIVFAFDIAFFAGFFKEIDKIESILLNIAAIAGGIKFLGKGKT